MEAVPWRAEGWKVARTNGPFASFNLDTVKAKIEEAKGGARRLRLLGRRVFSLEQDWLREAVRPLKRPDGGDQARVEIGGRC